MTYTRMIATLAAAGLLTACASTLPKYKPAERSVWLSQNWSAEERGWFHHTSQGTATMGVPYEWFMALEQPELKLFGTPGLFSDPGYLLRYGFVASPKGGFNKEGLPVGFAVDYDYKDPVSGKSWNALGFTCAACHTGHMTYKGTEVMVDGGPAVTDVTQMATNSVLAVAYTKYVPFRFDRFAERVLGANYNPENKAKLEKEFDAVWKQLKAVADLEMGVAKGSTKEGFARLDALSRIGNQVFGVSFKPSNYISETAPVSYPHIWDTSWFDLVQYDHSIMQPMIRNAGESLGVMAGINLNGPAAGRFDSTVKIKDIHEMEESLAGKVQPTQAKQFTGLRAPRWPEEIFGRIDPAKAAKGEALYEKNCQGCHLPPVGSAEFWDDALWTAPNAAGQRYLKVHQISIDELGTDPSQAKALAGRTVDTVGMGLNTTVQALGTDGNCGPVPVKDGPAVPYGVALGAVVQETTGRWYNQHNIPPAEREKMDGYRPNCLNPAMAYKARPLDGIWATPPYLHNGSVPNLYALLSPASERPATFYLGNQEFDPVHVGYEHGEFEGGFEVDTTISGNSNRGHEFDDKPRGAGVLGPKLSPEERMALIEFLKTL